MEKELLQTFLKTLFWSETGSNPITRRYAHNLVAAGITDLWTLLKTDSGSLIAIHGIGPNFIKTLESYKSEKGL